MNNTFHKNIIILFFIMKDETTENEKNLRVSENNNSKSTLTNSIHSNLPNLIKLIKKEEDLLFKSERKSENEEEIYNIENKIEENEKKGNINENQIYSRENFVSNRETILPLKIIDKNYKKINLNVSIQNTESIELNIDKILIKKKLNNRSSSQYFIIKISFLLVFIIFISLFLYYIYSIY